MRVPSTSALLIGLAAVHLQAQVRAAGASEAIIDAHWHTTLAPGDPRAPGAVARRREAIRAMDSLGVRHVVVIGTPDLLPVWSQELGNRAIPALLFPCEGGRAVNFGRQCFSDGATFPDTAWLRSEIKAGRVKALGEITAQYLGMAPNHPRLEPYYALAEELDVPVLIHLGFGPPAAPYSSSPVPRKSPAPSEHFREFVHSLSRGQIPRCGTEWPRSRFRPDTGEDRYSTRTVPS